MQLGIHMVDKSHHNARHDRHKHGRRTKPRIGEHDCCSGLIIRRHDKNHKYQYSGKPCIDQIFLEVQFFHELRCHNKGNDQCQKPEGIVDDHIKVGQCRNKCPEYIVYVDDRACQDKGKYFLHGT